MGRHMSLGSRSFPVSTSTVARLLEEPFLRCHSEQQRGVKVFQLQTLRWKHSARMGQHLRNLEEHAKEESHQEALERRNKKKQKKAAKGKKGDGDDGHDDEATAVASSMEDLMASHGADDSDEHHHHFDDEDDEDHDEDILPDLAKVKTKMTKIIDQFEASLKGIREAEPTPDIFDNIQVDAYGEHTPLKGVAQVVIQSHTLATATCFDPSLAKAVSTAIRNKLGLNPSVEEGGEVKIPLPRVSLETRKQTAHILNKRTESYRQRIRNVRRKAMDTTKKGVAGKLEGVSKDDAFRLQQDIEATTEDYVKKLNEISEVKHNRIMAV